MQSLLVQHELFEMQAPLHETKLVAHG